MDLIKADIEANINVKRKFMPELENSAQGSDRINHILSPATSFLYRGSSARRTV